jgi:hypothetical protein
MVANGPQREERLLEVGESLAEATAPTAVIAVPQSADMSLAAAQPLSAGPAVELSCDPVSTRESLDFASLNHHAYNDPQLDQLAVPAVGRTLRSDGKEELLQHATVQRSSTIRRQQAKQRLQRMKGRHKGKQPSGILSRGDGTVLDMLVSAVADTLKAFDRAIFRRKQTPEVISQPKLAQTQKHRNRHHAVSTGFFAERSENNASSTKQLREEATAPQRSDTGSSS